MNIVHTEASCGWGGQEIRIIEESLGMIARGHKVVILCPPESQIYVEAPKRGVPTEALPIGKKRLAGLLALRRWLSGHKSQVDVVNTHSSTDSWLVGLACSLLSDAPPVVRSRHISAPIPDNAPTRWLYTRSARHIVTTGEKLRRTLIDSNGYPAGQITSVPTGINTTLYQPGDKLAARVSVGLPEKGTIIGILATLRSWKGHSYLVEAFAQLQDRECRLLIVGDGPQRDALEQQVASLGLENQVLFAGNQHNVVPWLQSMDVCVLPSYANEGVPQALLQAMLCGLPTITTTVGSITEAAIDQETAIIVQPQDVASLLAALEVMLADSALRQRLGAAARAHCATHFAKESMVDKMERIFLSVRRSDASHQGN